MSRSVSATRLEVVLKQPCQVRVKTGLRSFELLNLSFVIKKKSVHQSFIQLHWQNNYGWVEAGWLTDSPKAQLQWSSRYGVVKGLYAQSSLRLRVWGFYCLVGHPWETHLTFNCFPNVLRPKEGERMRGRRRWCGTSLPPSGETEIRTSEGKVNKNIAALKRFEKKKPLFPFMSLF